MYLKYGELATIFSAALRCSIGIGPNIFLAKLGTEIQKPNGLVCIQLHSLPPVYSQLELRDIPGINWGMSYRLHSLGIRTPLHFYQAPRTLLHNALGISGDAWWYNLHGYKVEHTDNPTQSMSHSHVMAPELRTKTKARAVLYKLHLKIIERLRHKQLAAKELTIHIKCLPQQYYCFTFLVCPTQNAFLLFESIAKHYNKSVPHLSKPFKIRSTERNTVGGRVRNR